MSKSVEELKNMIRDNMNIDEIIESFERWYSPMEEESALLFETGTFDFTGKRQFYFSLVKQFPAEDDEYYQIHTDILYNPDSENKAFSETFWDETGEEIFDHIRNSKVFKYAQNHRYAKIEIYIDET